MMYVSGDTYGCATEESNACPMVVYLIYSFCLLTACQKHFAKAEKWKWEFIKILLHSPLISIFIASDI